MNRYLRNFSYETVPNSGAGNCMFLSLRTVLQPYYPNHPMLATT